MQNIILYLALGLLAIAALCIVAYVVINCAASVVNDREALKDFIADIATETIAVAGFFSLEGEKLYETFAEPDKDPHVCVIDQKKLLSLGGKVRFMVYNHIDGGSFTEEETKLFAELELSQAVVISNCDKKVYFLEPLNAGWGLPGDISDAFEMAEEEIYSSQDEGKLTDSERSHKIMELVAQDMHYRYIVKNLDTMI